MKGIIAILMPIILLSGCAAKKTMQEKSTTKEKGLINENFDPLILKDDDIEIIKKKPAEAKSDFENSIFQSIEETEDLNKELDGYRVQICALSDEKRARDVQREAILKFDENIYLIYDSPYYKVRIGDCVTRFEADKLQQIAVEKGFEDAWVVKTKVKPKKTETKEESISNPNQNNQ